MAAVVFPQEAVVQYVIDLLRIAGLATRDGATLARQAASLMNNRTHGRVMGSLRKYAVELEQFGADEILEIVTDMEGFVNPDDLRRKKQAHARTDAEREEWRQRGEAREKAAWEPGGAHWTEARDQMVADAHALIFAAKTIEDSDDERLVGVLRGYYEDDERSRLFARLVEALKPPPKVSAPSAKRHSRKKPHAKGDTVVYPRAFSAAAPRVPHTDGSSPDPPAAS